MNDKTLQELDFYRIRDSIASLCISEEGKEELENRKPFTKFEDFESLKSLSREWNKYLESSRTQPLSSWPKIKKLFPLMKTEGATLEQDDVYSLALFCLSQNKVITSLQKNEDNENQSNPLRLKKLTTLVEQLPDITEPSKEIFRVIDVDGKLKDLVEIRQIRKNILQIQKDINNLIKKYTSDSSLSSVLESNVPAFRANRQVLAVKSSQRSRIKGIVHEVSQTGYTVFIEPEDVVRRNNDLIEEEFHLQQEIRKVFTTLTAKLKPYTYIFEQSLPLMVRLDVTMAAAKWGIENSCTYALPCGDEKSSEDPSSIEPPLILQARHPLLGSHAVPIDVPFISGKKVLIITGPNTGGKTVTLKTIALFVLLNQAGFPLPAAEGTRLPIFDEIFADIGDEQSLDQSLSTFSGHMKNLAQALQHATNKSLVLLDELASGTDPQEGGAIAMAALDEFIERGSFVLVTTHHGILKNYGYTHLSCINASVEFNPDTLSPTYRILMGVPGESHALDIAKRSGLPESAVNKAKDYITSEQADVSALIKGLTTKHSELDALTRSFKNKENALLERIAKSEKKEIQLREREHELKKNENRKEMKFLSESRKKLENLVRILKEGEVTREKTLEVKNFISEVTQSIETHTDILDKEESNLEHDIVVFQEKEKNAKPSKKDLPKKRLKNSEAFKAATPLTSTPKKVSNVKLEFTPGATVVTGSSKQEGTLLRLEKKGLWSVQFGNIKMNVKQSELSLVKAPDIKPTVSYAYTPTTEEKPAFELRLMGYHTEEALKLLEHQIDLCVINNFSEFSIIHGKGTGTLQQAVQDYLAHYPGIESFNFAPPEDGGSGKTYVKLSL
jgi:DNA mismatch repair protein MutS2